MQKMPSALRVGDRVRVRRERWQISGIRQYGPCSVVTLIGRGTTNIGVTRQILTPFDSVEPLDRSVRTRVIGLRRWRRVCRALLATQGPADMLRTARRARIDLLPHQLEPALAVVRGEGCRLLLADDVGLGKTIQAGLIIAELQARQAAARILVLTPAGLREQWAKELAERFDLDPLVMDISVARRRSARLPIGVNPWTTIPIAIASFDYAKRPEVLPAILSCRWDVVAIDEAHGVSDGSDRRLALAAICQRAPYVVLLTATPHNGDRAAFESLCSLGALPREDPLLVFRRRRHETARGPERRIHRLMVTPTSAERRMHEDLSAFTQAIAADGGTSRDEVRLALTVLHKRSLSSARSLEQSVARRLAVVEEHVGGTFQPTLPWDDRADDLDPSDEAPIWSANLLASGTAELHFLRRLAVSAGAAAPNESKLLRLDRLLRRLERLGEPAIVFTEYRDTLAHVQQRLRSGSAVLHGGLTREERRAALDSFTSGRQPVLLATDAAGEGLNLHHNCRVVINLELPWNPMRAEQRIGRVDRIGQAGRVHVFHLITRDSGEMRILDYLEQRIRTASADIATANPFGRPGREDEDTIARCVIEARNPVAEASAVRRGPTANPDDPAPDLMRLIGLNQEAALEQARLVRARAFAGHDDEAEVASVGDMRLAAFVRRRPIRRQLGHGTLAILRETLEDACGRMVAFRLLPVRSDALMRVMRPVRPWIADLCRRIEAQVATGAAADDEWRREAADAFERFWQTRRIREMRIAACQVPDPPALVQTGLFDSRALRARAEEDDRRSETVAEGAARIDAASPGLLHRRPPHVVLALLPARSQ
jgi:superfamily II DNA or RNA helicase